jgi:hypothetical protein
LGYASEKIEQKAADPCPSYQEALSLMEDLLVALLQGGFEFIAAVFGFLGELFVDGLNWCWIGDLIDAVGRLFLFVTGSFADSWPGMTDNTRAGWISVTYFLVGLGTGAISLHLHHDVFLRRSAGRLLALGLSPIFSGYASWLNAKLSIFFKTTIRPAYCFWWMLLFSLGICPASLLLLVDAAF